MKRTVILFAFALALALVAGVFAGGQVYAEPTPGTQVHLPILNWLGEDNVCSSVIEVQNVGATFTKAMIMYWGEPGFCPPQCAGPIKVECTGLLKPGSTWNFLGAQVPEGAKKGIVFSLNSQQVGGDVFADAVCEDAFNNITLECDEYRRFKKAFDEGLTWQGNDFGTYQGEPLAVEVVRTCDPDPAAGLPKIVSAYSGVAGEMLGAPDPIFGGGQVGFMYYAPLIYSGWQGLDSYIYIQNAGLECTSVEIWLREQGECIRSQITEIPALAPGETYQYSVPNGWGATLFRGNAWIRSSVPLAIAVDNFSDEVLMTYHGKPAELNFTFEPDDPFPGQPDDPYFTQGSQVNYGPLIYREHQGWTSNIQVQNLSSIVNAKVKVYFLDNSGDIIRTIVDWICPRGSQTFPLTVIDGLPGNWVGQVRVESQEWWTPGDPKVYPPNVVSVAELVHYAGPAQVNLLEGVAYNLFPEQQAYDWQVGKTVEYGVDLIGIPSFMNNLDGITGLTTELAIQNVVPKPGFTDFAMFIYDQNGLLDFVCEKLNEKQVEYINVADWNYINDGFKGSAVISVTSWQHHGSHSPGLAAVKVERFGAVLNPDPTANPPGDESSASEGFPVFGTFDFEGPQAPSCPGEPGNCTGRISGSVHNLDPSDNDQTADQAPIQSVTGLADTGQSATTNFEGTYNLDVEPGDREVTFIHDDFLTLTKGPVQLACSDDAQLDAKLICEGDLQWELRMSPADNLVNTAVVTYTVSLDNWGQYSGDFSFTDASVDTSGVADLIIPVIDTTTGLVTVTGPAFEPATWGVSPMKNDVDSVSGASAPTQLNHVFFQNSDFNDFDCANLNGRATENVEELLVCAYGSISGRVTQAVGSADDFSVAVYRVQDDGAAITPTLVGTFDVSEQDGNYVASLLTTGAFDGFDQYEVRLRRNGVEIDTQTPAAFAQCGQAITGVDFP